MSLLRRAALPLCLLGVVQWFMWTADGAPTPGELASPASYSRVTRVMELAEHRSWYDGAATRANTPFGSPAESTRAMDVVLLAGAAAGAPLVGFERALEIWAHAVGPTLHVIALLVVLWALEPVLGARAVWAGALLPFQLLLSQQFAPGHADHSGLLIVLFAWLCGLTVRALRPGAGLGHAALAGVVASLAAWTSLQGLAGAAIVSLAFALIWLSGGTSVARQAYIFTAVVSIGLFAAAALERPPALLLEPGYRSVSAVHAFAFSVVAFAWLACGLLSAWTADRAWRRTLVVTLAAIAASSVTFDTFPDLFKAGPVPVGLEGNDLWLADLSPHSALIDTNIAFPRASGLLLMHLGPLLLALPYLRQAPRRARQHARRCWLLIAWGLALTVPLAVRDLRWAPLAQLFVLVPYAALAGAFADRFRPRQPLLRGAMAGITGVAFACSFLAGGARLAAAAVGSAPTPLRASAETRQPICDVAALATVLDTQWPQPQRIMTFVGFGPELIYRSHHAVVGTPSTSNVAGILDTIDFFASDDVRIAREVLQRRGIDAVAICPFDREAVGYRAIGTDPSVLDRLESGRQPSWLQRVDSGTFDASGFVAFRVRR